MENTTRNTHPMIIVAAVAVTIASLAAVASFTGLLPGKSAPEMPLTAAVPPPPSRSPKTQQAARDNPPPTGDLRHANEQTTAVIHSSRDSGPISRSASRAACGASGVAVTPGGKNR